MEKLKCKTCGCFSMIPTDVDVETDDPALSATEHESRFFTCHVCGDNWLSVKEIYSEGDSQITFIHQMGMEPVLKRVAHLHSEVGRRDETVDHWEYYMDDEMIAEELWQEKLESRRSVLKSICSN
jgi:hypothetical protein